MHGILRCGPISGCEVEALLPQSCSPAEYVRRGNKGERNMTENEKETIEQLAEEAEITLQEDYVKKDLKEKRGMIKNTLYDGSKKLKHRIPKGKQV